jgi:hypothetical protein
MKSYGEPDVHFDATPDIVESWQNAKKEEAKK